MPASCDATDAMIIAASGAQPELFGDIFDRHATVLFRYLVRRIGVQDADPLLGELFRVAFEKRATYDCTRPDARPWLYGIATNLLAHHRRSEARRLQATARLLAQRSARDEAMEPVAETVVRDVDASGQWPAVADAVSRLPSRERDVLLLHVWEDLSYEEIAAALDIPVGTVRSRLNRARVRIRELGRTIGRDT
jgi:RNA polymerase sigma factor (sigma-70 family)